MGLQSSEYEHKIGSGHKVVHRAVAVAVPTDFAVHKMVEAAAGHMFVESAVGSIGSGPSVLHMDFEGREIEAAAPAAVVEACCNPTALEDTAMMFHKYLGPVVVGMVTVAPLGSPDEVALEGLSAVGHKDWALGQDRAGRQCNFQTFCWIEAFCG